VRKKTNFTIPKTEGEGGRWAVFSGMALIICLGLLGPGCAPTYHATCSKDIANYDFVERLNVGGSQFKFEYPGNPELIDSRGFWFSRGDITSQIGQNGVPKPIGFGFDAVSMDFRAPDAQDNCSFVNMDDGCYQCNLCVTGLARCNNGINVPIVNNSFPIITLEEVEKGTRAHRVVQGLPDPGDACFMRAGNAGNASVIPEKSAVLTLEAHDICGGEPQALAKFETTVVNTPDQSFMGALEPFTDSTDPTTLRFKYSMHIADGILDENFSPDLRVTKVRVLENQFDEATMRERNDDSPAALKRMLPSRILFLPTFHPESFNDNAEEGTNRCYVDAAVEDGNFDLFRNCRKNPNSAELQNHEATPTYMNSAGLRHLTLTWVIEYKMSDGLTDPPNFEFGRPILQFMIEEVQ
jgi:hypothetical protein